MDARPALLLALALVPAAHAAHYDCGAGLEPVAKASDGSVACVAPGTASVLAERGWGEAPPPSELRGTVRAGQLAPLTGDLAGGGKAMTAATALAVGDFNSYLEDIGQEWSLELVTRDTETDPGAALEAAESLYSEGITAVLGPLSSASAEAVLGYADERGMLAVSCCSTAPKLAVAGDGLYRLTPDDSNEGAALAALLEHHGVELAVPAWRDDAWGNGLERAWREASGPSAGAGIKYDPDHVDPAAVAAALAAEVGSFDRSAAVVVFGFSETADIVRESMARPELAAARWYASGVVNSSPDFMDPEVSSFLESVMFTTPGAKAAHNRAHAGVQERLSGELGETAGRTFVHASYDSAWLLGLSILEAGSSEAADVGGALAGVADGRQGAIGDMTLNAAGDLLRADYEFWQTAADGIKLAATYESGRLVPAD